MSKIERLNLIEGSFSNEEASEILMNIFLTKINFHEKKNFSSQIRYGSDNETSKKRIPELKMQIEKLLEIVAEAKSKNQKMMITSEINIALFDD
jgi:hypothetical protein